MSSLQIVTLDPQEWQIFKEFRLEALLTEPQAFGTSYADALQKTDAFWQGRLVEAEEGKKGWLLFARENDQIIGMIGAYTPEENDIVNIISVYVRRAKRGQGVASALMSAILEAVSERRTFRKAVLSVTASQVAAINLYQRFGFRMVGEANDVMGDGIQHRGFLMEKDLFSSP